MWWEISPPWSLHPSPASPCWQWSTTPPLPACLPWQGWTLTLAPQREHHPESHAPRPWRWCGQVASGWRRKPNIVLQKSQNFWVFFKQEGEASGLSERPKIQPTVHTRNPGRATGHSHLSSHTCSNVWTPVVTQEMRSPFTPGIPP